MNQINDQQQRRRRRRRKKSTQTFSHHQKCVYILLIYANNTVWQQKQQQWTRLATQQNRDKTKSNVKRKLHAENSVALDKLSFFSHFQTINKKQKVLFVGDVIFLYLKSEQVNVLRVCIYEMAYCAYSFHRQWRQFGIGRLWLLWFVCVCITRAAV